MLSVGIDLHRPEGEIAAMFEAHQKRYPDVPMGSYPFIRDGKPGTQLVLRSTDEARLADYLIGDSELLDSTLTCFTAIRRLPPAHVAVIENAALSLVRYWRPDAERETRFSSDEEYEEGFREVFREAVRCRLRGFPWVGSMLSGGLDSGSIVCVAREVLRETGAAPLPVFSALSDDKADSNEAPYAHAVMRMGGLDETVVRPATLQSFLPDFHNLLETSDDLFDFTMAGIPLVMYGAARRRGIRALLDGVDGDLATSAGLPSIGEWVLRGQWSRAWNEARGFARFYGLGRFGAQRAMWNHGARLLAPKTTRLLSETILRKDPISLALRRASVAPELARRVDLAERLRRCVTYQAREGFRSARHWQARLLDSPILPVALERYDRIAALQSIEPRHPFIDRRVVEYCMALPLEQKVRDGWAKRILRRSLGRVLPDVLRWRTSTASLHAEFLFALMNLEREKIAGTLGTISPMERRYTRPLASSFRWSKWSEASEAEKASPVWDAVTLAWWLRRRASVMEANNAR
jgi:asparagine synthase (glutamine-hydrolysing)